MSEFAGNLPQTFIGFRCLEKISITQEKNQTKEDQQLVFSLASAVSEMIEIPECDKLPVETMPVLRSAQPGNTIGKTLRNTKVDRVGSAQSSGYSDVNAYCEDKLWSLSEGELQIIVEVGGESIAQFLCGQISSSGAAMVVQGWSEEVFGMRSSCAIQFDNSENFDWN